MIFFVYSVTYLQNRYINFRGIEISKCKSCVINNSDLIALRAVLIFVKPKAYDTNTYFFYICRFRKYIYSDNYPWQVCIYRINETTSEFEFVPGPYSVKPFVIQYVCHWCSGGLWNHIFTHWCISPRRGRLRQMGCYLYPYCLIDQMKSLWRFHSVFLSGKCYIFLQGTHHVTQTYICIPIMVNNHGHSMSKRVLLKSILNFAVMLWNLVQN